MTHPLPIADKLPIKSSNWFLGNYQQNYLISTQHKRTHIHSHTHTQLHTQLLHDIYWGTQDAWSSECHVTDLLIVDLCSSLAYFMMTHPLPVGSKLPIKTLVVRQLPTNTHTHTHTYTHTHAHNN